MMEKETNRPALFFFDCETEYSILKEELAAAEIFADHFSWIHGFDRAALGKFGERVREAAETRRAAVLFRIEFLEPELEEFFEKLKGRALLVPAGSEAALMRVHTIPGRDVETVNRYLLNGGAENIRGVFAYIRKHLLGDESAGEPAPPAERPFSGIFDPASDRVWDSLEEYLKEPGKKFPAYAGWFIHRQSWNMRDTDDVAAARELFAELGIGLIPVFSSSDERSPSFRGAVERYFSLQGRLAIDALVNRQIFAVRAEEERSVNEQSVFEFQKLGIPVLSPIHSFHLTEEQWRRGVPSLSMDMPSAYLTPEAAGMAEPIIISTRGEGGMKSGVMTEMVRLFCGKTARWIALRKKKNREKKLVFMLHSAVCSGVEATIGKAYGLDAMESLCRLAQALAQAGYDIGDFPATGKELFDDIMRRKAFSDFRWTAVEDIAAAGGCLYKMNADEEYMNYYRALPDELRGSMEESWGPPPGEGMVIGRDLIITGAAYGNITVMIQPKRGCYGAKCTGEVCRILHDPACPPPHQYFAVYRYIEHVLKADACVDVGTEGSLEFLPGRANGLSARCWPYVMMGTLPSIYIYNAGVPGEAMIAKRRMNALTIGHLPPAFGEKDKNAALLLRAINEYFAAADTENSQMETISKRIDALLEKLPAAAKTAAAAASRGEGLRLAAGALTKTISSGKLFRNHILGEKPAPEEAVCYIKEVAASEGWEMELTSGGDGRDAAEREIKLTGCVEEALAGGDGPRTEDMRQIGQGLAQCVRETAAIVRALSGEYIEPGPCGMPDENGRGILPTGRNLCSLDTKKIPTRAAYEAGTKAAEALIAAYIKDEGQMPRKAAVNMMSLDITKTKGEQLSQFLNLIGIRPEWDAAGNFTGLAVIPLSELGRPRIDVTVRITGVLRDTWPFALKIMDDAVLLAASQDEGEDDNFIIKHVNEYLRSGAEGGFKSAATRIFGDAPGAYGAGIDLALLASAWENEDDLAKYFIQASAFAYGGGRGGEKSIREFIDNMRKVDLSADASVCKRVDSVACGFGLQVHGGFRLAAKMLGKKDIRQYQYRRPGTLTGKTLSLTESVKEELEATLLNPLWLENRKNAGRDGASDIMHMMQSIFMMQCACAPLDDKILDGLAENCVNNPEIREWMLKDNRFAAEETARRMLELNERGKWAPAQEVLARLRENYLAIEGDMEGETESVGEMQGGAVEKVSHRQVERWAREIADIEAEIKRNKS